MVAPSFLALTSTPSMAPSSFEDTIPVSAACARAPPVANAVANRETATPNQIFFGRMGHLPNDSLLFGKYCAFSADTEAGAALIRGTLCAASVPMPTFVSLCSTCASERRHQRTLATL